LLDIDFRQPFIAVHADAPVNSRWQRKAHAT
jgi:hypothetical protein